MVISGWDWFSHQFSNAKSRGNTLRCHGKAGKPVNGGENYFLKFCHDFCYAKTMTEHLSDLPQRGKTSEIMRKPRFQVKILGQIQKPKSNSIFEITTFNTNKHLCFMH